MTDGYYKHEVAPLDEQPGGDTTKVYYFFRYKNYRYIKAMDVKNELVDDPDMIKIVESIAMKEAEKEYDNMVSTLKAR